MSEITFSSPTLLSLFIYFWLVAVNGWDLFPNPSPVPLEAVVAPLLTPSFLAKDGILGSVLLPFLCQPLSVHRHSLLSIAMETRNSRESS